MAQIRSAAGRYEACCEHCGAWREVKIRQLACDTFFENFQADFICCGVQQAVKLAVEKDEIDFH